MIVRILTFLKASAPNNIDELTMTARFGHRRIRIAVQASPISFSLSGPKLVSTLLDNAYATEICRKAFPPGKFFQMPATPNVTEINSIGGFASPFDISYDRLAFINGQCESSPFALAMHVHKLLFTNRQTTHGDPPRFTRRSTHTEAREKTRTCVLPS